jgi:hypothetical protein
VTTGTPQWLCHIRAGRQVAHAFVGTSTVSVCGRIGEERLGAAQHGDRRCNHCSKGLGERIVPAPSRRSTAAENALTFIRGPMSSVVERATSNGDAKAMVHNALSKVANAIERGEWPLTEEALDRILGPGQGDSMSKRKK